jgi:hypothetical protein
MSMEKLTVNIRLTRIPENTRGGVRCLGGVSIPYRQVTPVVSPIFRLGKRYEM